MGWLSRTRRVPTPLSAALQRDEQVLRLAELADGSTLATTRFGLWHVVESVAERWDWHLISKARLAERVLSVTVADEVTRWPDGTVVLVDRPEVQLEMVHLGKLSDGVHDRVRRSVCASRHIRHDGIAGWVVLRRVPGQNGLTVQFRVDPGSDRDASESGSAIGTVSAVADAIWPPAVPRPGSSEE